MNAVTASDPMAPQSQVFASMQDRPDVPRLTVLTPLPEIVAELERYRPDVLLSSAGIVAALAEEALAGRLLIAPRIVITTAEVLTEDAARRIEDARRVRPINAYAATETTGPTRGAHRARAGTRREAEARPLGGAAGRRPAGVAAGR
ncbi:MAG TPA: hypothetical protein VNJ46_01815 [Gaiellaceae bacterium]|nr:hypothetical protein [Gaiellaceae bacterium]